MTCVVQAQWSESLSTSPPLLVLGLRQRSPFLQLQTERHMMVGGLDLDFVKWTVPVAVILVKKGRNWGFLNCKSSAQSTSGILLDFPHILCLLIRKAWFLFAIYTQGVVASGFTNLIVHQNAECLLCATMEMHVKHYCMYTSFMHKYSLSIYLYMETMLPLILDKL